MDKKEEILEEIKKIKQKLKELDDKLIDFELPKNYDKMTDAEKKAYHKKQDKLKKEALNNMDNYSVVVNDYTMVSYPKNKAVTNKFAREHRVLYTIALIRDAFKKSIPDKYKDLHKQNLEKIEKQIERYNSTKAIRNDRIEFGPNFNNFIETYFNKSQCTDINKEADKNFLKKYERQQDKNGNIIGDQYKFQNLNDEQKKFLIKARMKAFANKLEDLEKIARIKVKKDSKAKQVTFLEKYGFLNNQVAFRNGSKKWTTVKSVVSKSGLDMSKKKLLKSKLKHKNEIEETREQKNKSRYIELSVMREKFDKFVKFYKGNGRQFSIEFNQNFPEIAEKLYQSKGGGLLSFRTQNLASSPISVQQHEIEKHFEDEFRKVNFRLRYRSFYIPASSSVCASYLGKMLTNAKTQTEKNLDLMRVKEYEKELRNISLREDLIGYESIFESMSKSAQNEFSEYIKKHTAKFTKMSERSKKNELKKFIGLRIQQLKETVHKNKFFSSGTEKLQRMNGVLISKKDKLITKEMKSIIDALGDEQGGIYKNIVQNIKELTARLNNEKQTIDKLGEKLEKLSNKPYSFENNNQIQKILNETNAHNKKMAIIKSSLDNAIQKKSIFESNFASAQIKKAVKSEASKKVSFNTSNSVFDRYAFPAIDTFGEKYFIEKGTLEGKQVEKIVSSFIMNFKNQVQNMRLTFAESNNAVIQDYIMKLDERIEDDFGANIRDLKKTQKVFIAQLQELKKSNETEVSLELEKYIQRLSKIESDLIKKLKAMNIEIGDVTLAKNKK